MKTIAIFGAGLMGSAAGKRLASLGYRIIFYKRDLSEKIPDNQGRIHMTDDPQAALDQAKCVLLFLPDYSAIEEVFFHKPLSLARSVIVQMGTISPLESGSLKEKFSEKQADYFECPVLGSRKEASDGKLIMMAGATQEQYNQWKNLLSGLGKDLYYIGEVGKAAVLKLALNQLIASYAVSFSLSLSLLKKHGIDAEIFSHVLKQSSLYAGMFDKKFSRWSQSDYANPNFPLKHLLKDVDLIYAEAEKLGIMTEHLSAVRSIILKAIDQGFAEKDYSAVYEALDQKDET